MAKKIDNKALRTAILDIKAKCDQLLGAIEDEQNKEVKPRQRRNLTDKRLAEIESRYANKRWRK